MERTKKYEVIETIGKLTRDPTSYGYQFSIEQLEVERLVENYDFRPHENKRVKVIIMISDEEVTEDYLLEARRKKEFEKLESTLCIKCGQPKTGRGVTYATETEPEKYYVFCANIKDGCYKGW